MVKVDKAKCIGCGACAAVCPESFEMKGDKAVAKKNSKCAKEAAESCPVNAISI